MNPVEKYNKRAREINSLLCVGLDPDLYNLNYPKGVSQFEFCKKIIDETHEYAAAFKPNSAFFEAAGAEGLAQLKKTIDYIHEHHPDIFTILDAKRGDIGNTNNGYVASTFDWLGFDAVTVSPYLGQEAVKPFIERKDKVSIILCRTSNSGAGEFQDKVWQDIAEKFSKYENCMLVAGATYPEEMKKIREISGDTTLLVPGVGAQGGSVEEVVKAGLNSEGLGLIISSSRGIIFSDNPKEEAKKLRDEINKYR